MVHDSKPTPSSSRTCHSFCIVAVAVLTNFLAGGFVFGFSSLVAIMRVSGVYVSLCEDASGTVVLGRNASAPSITPSPSAIADDSTASGIDIAVSCPERELALGRIFLFGSVAAIGMTLPHGIVMDHFGPKTTGILSFVLFFIGCILFSLSTATFDGRGSGFLLLGAAAPGFIMSSFHVAALAPKRVGLAMAALNGAYDSSAITLQVFLAVFMSYDFDGPESAQLLLRNIFFVYIGSVFLPLAIAYVLVMPRQRMELKEPGEEGEEDKGSSGEEAEELSVAAVVSPMEVEASEYAPESSNISGTQDGTVTQELLSIRWVLFTLWFSSSLLRFSYYLSSIGPSLAAIEKGQEGSESTTMDSNAKVVQYLTIFGSILPTGFLCTPFVGAFIDRASMHFCILAVLCVGLMHSITCLIPFMEAQIATFCLFTIFRAIFFGVATTFAVKLFPPAALGRVYGLTTLVAAGVSTLQYPLLDMGLILESGFFWPNILILVTSILFGLPLFFFVWYKSSRE